MAFNRAKFAYCCAYSLFFLPLQEGIQEPKLEQQLAPAREAVARTLTVGSSNFFKAVGGRWGHHTPPYDDGVNTRNKMPRTSTPPVEVSKADWEEETCHTATLAGQGKKPERFSSTGTNSPSFKLSPSDTSFKPPNTSWGTTTFGSFLSARAREFQLMPLNTPATARPGDGRLLMSLPRFMNNGEGEGSPLFIVAAAPAASPSAPVAHASVSINALLNLGTSTQTLKVSSNENGVVVAAHDGPSELR